MSNQAEQVLSHDILKKKQQLSKVLSSGFQYWMGHVANWSIVLSLFTVAYFNKNEISTTEVISYIGSGLFFWTFAEYLFHRWGYHKNESFFAVGHLMHHDEPEALLGMPWIINVIALSSITAILVYFFSIRISVASILVASFWLGHIWYTLVHHGIHHWDFKWAWFRELKRHHKVHHKMDDKNLGVTTIFWDRIFKTRI